MLGLRQKLILGFGVLLIILMALGVQRRIWALVAASAGFLVGFGPYLIWSRILYGGFLETLRRGWANLGGEAFPPSYYLGVLPEMLTWTAVAGLVLWLVRRLHSTVTSLRMSSDSMRLRTIPSTPPATAILFSSICKRSRLSGCT